MSSKSSEASATRRSATSDSSGIQFRCYFAGAPRACAIRVGRTHRLDTTMAIDDPPGVERPPQSFQYLNERAADAVGITATGPLLVT